PRSDLDGRRYTRPSLRSAVEHRLGEIRRRRFQNLVRPLQFEVLALEILQLLTFVRRQARALTAVAFGVADPPPKCFHGAADLLGDGSDRAPLGGAFVV